MRSAHERTEQRPRHLELQRAQPGEPRGHRRVEAIAERRDAVGLTLEARFLDCASELGERGEPEA